MAAAQATARSSSLIAIIGDEVEFDLLPPWQSRIRCLIGHLIWGLGKQDSFSVHQARRTDEDCQLNPDQLLPVSTSKFSFVVSTWRIPAVLISRNVVYWSDWPVRTPPTYYLHHGHCPSGCSFGTWGWNTARGTYFWRGIALDRRILWLDFCSLEWETLTSAGRPITSLWTPVRPWTGLIAVSTLCISCC